MCSHIFAFTLFRSKCGERFFVCILRFSTYYFKINQNGIIMNGLHNFLLTRWMDTQFSFNEAHTQAKGQIWLFVLLTVQVTCPPFFSLFIQQFLPDESLTVMIDICELPNILFIGIKDELWFYQIGEFKEIWPFKWQSWTNQR